MEKKCQKRYCHALFSQFLHLDLLLCKNAHEVAVVSVIMSNVSETLQGQCLANRGSAEISAISCCRKSKKGNLQQKQNPIIF